MALPCPERDALESAEQRSTPWRAALVQKITQESRFELITGERVYFHGVSNGTSMRENPNLHIAVFMFVPPTNSPTNLHLLPNCKFGGLITGPDDNKWYWAEGLRITSVRNGNVRLKLVGRRAQFRPI